MNFAWHNGVVVAEEQVRLSPADRSFRLGDGVFETIACHNGALFNWAAHEARLHIGASAIGLTLPEVNFQDACQQVVQRNGLREGIIRIAVSRGEGSQGYLPTGAQAQAVVTATARTGWKQPPARLMVSRYRKIPPQCLPVQCKLANGLNSTLARLEAHEAGCDEAIQLTVDGWVAEASSANLFWYADGRMHTPALNLGVLDGTTRRLMRRLSPLEVSEGAFALEAVLEAEAILLTSVGCGVRDVASIHGYNWAPRNPAVVAEWQFLYEREVARQCR